MHNLFNPASCRVFFGYSVSVMAARVLAATGDVETVQTILGHQCLDHSKPYLTIDRPTIRRAFELAL
jgi:hypothetical protein